MSPGVFSVMRGQSEPFGCIICKQLVFCISGLGIYRFLGLGSWLEVGTTDCTH